MTTAIVKVAGDNDATAGKMCSKRGGRPTQSARRFENIVCRHEFIALKNEVTKSARVALLSKRASLVGIINPDEPTLYRMTALLAWA